MWEDLKVYKQLDKKDINPAFKKFGKAIVNQLDNYNIDLTSSTIKIYKIENQLELATFIEKDSGGYGLKVKTSIKPIDFYRKHKFSMINIVPLGDILNNYRRTNYPLTKEWNELAAFLAKRIKIEIENYFQMFNSYERIIQNRTQIERVDGSFKNEYELLIYASIRTINKDLLILYLDKKIKTPATMIGLSEFLKPNQNEVNEEEFLKHLKLLASRGDFGGIEQEIAKANANANT